MREGERAGAKVLRLADAFLRSGDIEGAIRHYLLYCEHIERLEPDRELLLCNTRLSAIRRRILALDPPRRDVRQALARNYIALGLLDEARVELLRVAVEAGTAHDTSAEREALELLEQLSSKPV